MQTLKIKITGDSALLMNKDTLSDPLNPKTQEIKVLTSKRKKVEEDHLQIAELQYKASAYYDESIGLYMPGAMFKASMVTGAKLQRLGATFKRAVIVLEDQIPLQYEGPRELNALWENKDFVDVRSVGVQSARLMRYRPKVRNWSATATVLFSPEMVEEADLLRALDNAGMFAGVGDFRPECGGNFGRYSVEVLR